MTTSTPSKATALHRRPLYFQIAAWAVPVMLVGGFALIALVPVLIVLIGSFTDPRIRYLRWWSAALAALYSTPLAILNIRSDPAPSLTQDMHPVFLVLILGAAAAVLIRLYAGHRR